MSSDWAEENLQVIRQLMERSSVYRRKMAPMMLAAAVIGTLAGFGADVLKVQTPRMFAGYWGGIACVILLVSGYIVRSQAIRNRETFWTAPTWRIFVAFLPTIVVGGAVGVAYMLGPETSIGLAGHVMLTAWCVLYGLGLHAAGFFVAKGIRRMGWVFILLGLFFGYLLIVANPTFLKVTANFLMTAVFGGLHMFSGIYLFYTEQRDDVA